MGQQPKGLSPTWNSHYRKGRKVAMASSSFYRNEDQALQMYTWNWWTITVASYMLRT